MPYLVLDIETIRDPDLPAWDEGRGFPPPPYHRIVSLGCMWLDPTYAPRRLATLTDDADEVVMLERFARVLLEDAPTLVTWNGRGFDLPVIVTRAMKHGVQMPDYFRQRDYRYRFSSALHIDLADQLCDHGAAPRSSLDVVAKMLGLPGKGDVCGSDVQALWDAGKLDEIQAYNLDDVVQTAHVFLRWQHLRGHVNDIAGVTAALDGFVAGLKEAA